MKAIPAPRASKVLAKAWNASSPIAAFFLSVLVFFPRAAGAADPGSAPAKPGSGDGADAGPSTAPPGSVGSASSAAAVTPTLAETSNAVHPEPEVLLTGPLHEAIAVREGRAISPGSKANEALVLPTGYLEVGGEMAFLMGRLPFRSESLEFTDIGLFRARARRTFADSLEVSLGTELLAKQQSDSDEPLWQGANIAFRAPFAKRFAAGLAGALGPLYTERGFYWQVEPMLQTKFEVNEWTRFELGLGNLVTVLQFRQDKPGAPFWIDEIAAHGEVQFGERYGACWLGIDYHVPIASHPSRPSNASVADLGPYLNPQVQLNVHVGGVVTLDNWDIYGIVSFIDRGQIDRPDTVLPILDGGFDQKQITFGVLHRFGTPQRSRAYEMSRLRLKSSVL